MTAAADCSASDCSVT